MTTWIRSHPTWWPSQARTANLPVAKARAAEIPSAEQVSSWEDRLVTVVCGITAILAGICVAMSVVTVFLRLMKNAASFLG